MLAYSVFWLISFGLIFSIFSRQKKLDQELSLLRDLVEESEER
jgi:CcmD family protein